MRQSVLERIVEERVGQTLTGTVSLAVDRLAEEIAREALADEAFRKTLRELVRRRSEAMLEELLGNGTRQARSPRSKGSRKGR